MLLKYHVGWDGSLSSTLEIILLIVNVRLSGLWITQVKSSLRWSNAQRVQRTAEPELKGCWERSSEFPGFAIAERCSACTESQNADCCVLVVMKAYINLYAFWTAPVWDECCHWRDTFGYDTAGTPKTNKTAHHRRNIWQECGETSAPTPFDLHSAENKPNKNQADCFCHAPDFKVLALKELFLIGFPFLKCYS